VISGEAGVVMTVGAGQTIRGNGDIQVAVNNQGTIEADRSGGVLRISGAVVNTGTLRAVDGGTLVLTGGLDNDGELVANNGVIDLNGSLILGGASSIETLGTGTLKLSRHLRADGAAEGATTSALQLILDGGGSVEPDLAGVVFFVEAEDFNFDEGEHMPAADVMPYLGGAYQNRAGDYRVDYYQTGNQTASDLYRVNEGPGLNVNIYAISDQDRGRYRMDVNYKIGNNDATEWYNYTRNYPAPTEPSYFFARLASGSQANAIRIDEVTGPADTTSQTLTNLGEVRGPASAIGTASSTSTARYGG